MIYILRPYPLLLSLLVSIAAATVSTAQTVCDSVFLKEYAATGDIEPLDIKYLSDNDILVVGRGNTGTGTASRALAARLSASGQVRWSLLMGGGVHDVLTGIVPLSNGSYLLYGTTTSFGHSADKILLVNVSPAGNVLWSRQLGTAATEKNSIKKIKQYSDGDLIGTFNINDSTAQSDPVLFKMGLDGTVRWLRQFNNNAAESFTGLDFLGNTLYAAGFFTGTNKNGVLTRINAVDGSVTGSDNLLYDSTMQTEVINLQIANNTIAYGLWMKKVSGINTLNKTILIQTDNGGNKSFETILDNGVDTLPWQTKKTNDGSFLVLNNYLVPQVVKLNRFNNIDWSTRQARFGNSSGQFNHSLDATPTGGSVSGGSYRDVFFTGGLRRMTLAKTNPQGELGSCRQTGFTFFTDTVTIRQRPFTWQSVQPAAFAINQAVTLNVVDNFVTTVTDICNETFCTDTMPLPPGCTKTYLVEYAAPQMTRMYDAVYTTDGGRVAVGTINRNGWIAKFQQNGDVEWSKRVDEFSHNLVFRRVLRTTDNYLLAFANNYYTIRNNAYRTVKVVKLDNNGNIVLSREIIVGFLSEMGDVTATPDGGFAIVLNRCYGCGYLYTYVIRLDANLQVIWRKELKHSILSPIYKSITCTNDAVYVGQDNYDDFNKDKGGVTKLSLATGDSIWNRQFVVSNQHLLFNKLAVVNDTVYAFVNIFAPNTGGSFSRLQMVRLSNAGLVIDAKVLGNQDIVQGTVNDYLDAALPMVTLTPQNNFVFSAQVQTPTGRALNITRFTTNGDALWSKNYSQLPIHRPSNIHPNAGGFFIVGTVNRPLTTNPQFTNSFMLKVDSTGNIVLSNATCSNTTVPFPTVPGNASHITWYYIDSVVNFTELLVQPSPVLSQTTAMDAELSCSQQSLCGPVTLAVLGNGCSNDTLTYYLSNNTCGAVATWRYDTAFFSPLLQSADTLKLRPRTTGNSQVTAIIENDCSITTQSLPVTILVSTGSVNLGNDTILCPGSNIVLRAGPGYQSYRWNNGTTDSLLTVNAPGLYYVQVSDNCGGTATDSILISGINNTLHITGSPAKCNADTVMLTATAGYTNYQWLPGGNALFNGNLALVNPAQTTWYYVQAQILPGCIARDSFLVTVNTSPPINLGRDTALCYNQTILLTVPAAFAAQVWNTGSVAPGIAVATPGLYAVAATFGNGCISRDTIVVSQWPFVAPVLGNDTALCRESNFRLSPGTYSSYQWNTGAVGSSIAPLAAGQYWVTVTDNNGCQGSDTIRIIAVNPRPSNFLAPQAQICWRENISLSPNLSFVNYSWSNGASSPTITVNAMGAYTLTVTDANGCIGKDTIQVIRKPGCIDTVYIVNAFTPNADGKNDWFKPIFTGTPIFYSLTVFNRYGQAVFSTSNPSIGWDGSFKGVAQPQGNYVYACQYQLAGAGQDKQSQQGSVLLVR